MQQENRLSFYDEIRKNKIYSIILMFIVFSLLVIFGYIISYLFDKSYFFIIMIFSIIFSLSYILFGYYQSDKISIASVNAKLAPREKYRQYYDLVEGLTLASGLPMPKLYIMENSQINAFASGRDPKHAVICVTTGALEKLDKRELEGVLSHELSHIANYDIRFMTLVAVLVGMIAILSEVFLRSLWFKSSDNNDSKASIILMIAGIIFAILAPIAVQLVQLAISRKREFAADSSAVKFTRTPTGLIGALEKIKKNSEMKVSGAVSPLFLANPSSKLKSLFQTHPPLEVRIDKLRRM
ncbi:MAG: M48 family metallopeptidase [Nanoarchaeota archaeon]|nr:M48 family metallopeptidase [Nanoarchaeota archaeon]